MNIRKQASVSGSEVDVLKTRGFGLDHCGNSQLASFNSDAKVTMKINVEEMDSHDENSRHPIAPITPAKQNFVAFSDQKASR